MGKDRGMSEELNCTNCSIGDFKAELCDCDNGFYVVDNESCKKLPFKN